MHYLYLDSPVLGCPDVRQCCHVPVSARRLQFRVLSKRWHGDIGRFVSGL